MTDIRNSVRWGTWVTAGVLLLVLYRSEGLNARSGDTRIQQVAYLITVGAWSATAWLLAWRQPPVWPRRALAVVLALVTVGATAAVSMAVPAALQHTTANWAVGANGWLLLTVASGGRVTLLLLSLTAQVMIAMAAALPAGPAEIVLFTARAIGILGLQVPIALAARAIERSAEATRQLHLTREAIRTEQFVAATLHADRLRRSRAVAAAIEPVLASLASSAPGPDPDDTLRQRIGAAAGQVRRLLAEWQYTDGDPLGTDLSARLDDLQAAGTQVVVAIHADRLPPVLRRTAADVVREIARRPTTRLRLTAVPTATQVCLSVVADIGSGTSRFALPEVPVPVAVSMTTADETLWVELTCPV